MRRIRGFGNLRLGFYASKRKKRARSPDDGCVLNIKCPRRFSSEELRRVTNDFSNTNVIGSGGYGKVYKAMLDHGQMVAIKRSLELHPRFRTEVELLSRLRHNNLLDLIGFCVERGEQMLVYDYIPNGSLEDIFFGNTEIQLDWGSRVGIALLSARALAYLHNDANPRVIHRNVKPSNILVDENLTAKVAHLGLAKMLPAEPNEGDSHVTTEVVGTLGYLDSEYLSTGQLSVKSDVYGLGIVLLQLITRRRVIDMDSEDFDRKIINNLVKETLESGGIRRLKEELMDPLLRDSVLVGFERFLRLALTCARKQGSQRPSMREVVKELESILDMDMETETETETEGFFQFSPQLRRDNSYNDIDSSSSIEVDISPQPRPEDVGPYQPPGTSPIQRRGEVAPVPPWDAEDYEAVEQNLEGLITNIPDMLLGEVPRRYQRHTVGVLESIGRLLRRVARAIVCYC